MKKTLKFTIPIVVIAIAILGFQLLGRNAALEDEAKNTVTSETKESEKISYEVSYSSDYLHITPTEVFENSTLVVIGEYVTPLKSYMGDDQRAYTMEKFKVNRVVKGDYKADTIVISRLGGTVPLKEYLNTQTKEQIEKKGLNKLSDAEIKKSQVRFVPLDNEIKLEKVSKEQYVLLLNYDEKTDTYVTSSGEYSVLKYNPENREVYNITNASFEKAEFLK